MAPSQDWLFVRSARAMLARDAGAGVDIKSAETLVLGPECRRFSYAELDTATNGYPDANVIGEGGFGKARGCFPTCSCLLPGQRWLTGWRLWATHSRVHMFAVCQQRGHGVSYRQHDHEASCLVSVLTMLAGSGPQRHPVTRCMGLTMHDALRAGVPGRPGRRQIHCREEARPARHAGLHVDPFWKLQTPVEGSRD